MTSPRRHIACRAWAAAIGAAALALAGCQETHPQSMLHPVGPAAELISRLWWVMCAVLGGVFVVVMVLAVVALRRSPRSVEHEPAPPLGRTGFIVAGGLVLPTVILIGLLILTLQTTASLRIPETKITIEIIGQQWWWRVRYPGHGFETANQIYIPAGEPVRLEVTSADVIHSLWIPNLNGKIDMVPGRVNPFWIQADKPGVYRGQCAEYCGIQHALMAMAVVVLEPEAFEARMAAMAQPAPPPIDEQLRLGHDVFFTAGCANCHAIRGTQAVGDIGPDLTHLGSRLTLGAGTIPNSHGHLAGWISNPQAIKPGNLMPPSYLTPQQLHALVAYLRSLD